MRPALDYIHIVPQLPFGWWLPTAPPHGLQCNTSNYVTLSANAFGQSNNVLRVLGCAQRENYATDLWRYCSLNKSTHHTYKRRVAHVEESLHRCATPAVSPE